MKKGLFLFAFALIAATTFAQEPLEDFTSPNYKAIEKEVTNSASNFYYPHLFERYKMGDSTLTIDEKRHIYYGYVFQPEYVATEISASNKIISELLAKQIFTNDDYDSILQHADVLLKEDPFNLRALNAKLFVYAQQNNVEAYKKNALKRRVIQDAIISSGDGMSAKTPFYVIKVAHEYDMLSFLGYRFGGTHKIVKKCNYLTVDQNRYGVEKIYFEISPVLKYASKHGTSKL